MYLINPFFGIGAFLHSFLDSFTTTRDRGVEWLYPFSRMVTKAVYDSSGNKLPLDPKHKIYFLSNDLPGLTRRTTKDIKPGETPVPNRRTYGPALSGKFLDRSIFFGSIALFFLLLLFSVLGLRQFIDLSLQNITLSLIMNPTAVSYTLSILPYIAVGIVVVVFVSLGVLRFSTRGFSVDSKKEPLIV